MSALERLKTPYVLSGVNTMAAVRIADLALALAVIEAAQTLFDGTSINFEWPEYTTIKEALAALTKTEGEL